MIQGLKERIRDRLSAEWLTPSQSAVWKEIHRFAGPPHRVINIFGLEGTGKSFIGWLMERENYASFCTWPDVVKPILPRLSVDNAPSDRLSARELRPLVDKLTLQQIILLTRVRVDEPAMPAFELKVTEIDLEIFRANFYRYLRITLPETSSYNYKSAIEMLTEENR